MQEDNSQLPEAERGQEDKRRPFYPEDYDELLRDSQQMAEAVDRLGYGYRQLLLLPLRLFQRDPATGEVPILRWLVSRHWTFWFRTIVAAIPAVLFIGSLSRDLLAADEPLDVRLSLLVFVLLMGGMVWWLVFWALGGIWRLLDRYVWRCILYVSISPSVGLLILIVLSVLEGETWPRAVAYHLGLHFDTAIILVISGLLLAYVTWDTREINERVAIRLHFLTLVITYIFVVSAGVLTIRAFDYSWPEALASALTGLNLASLLLAPLLFHLLFLGAGVAVWLLWRRNDILSARARAAVSALLARLLEIVRFPQTLRDLAAATNIPREYDRFWIVMIVAFLLEMVALLAMLMNQMILMFLLLFLPMIALTLALLLLVRMTINVLTVPRQRTELKIDAPEYVSKGVVQAIILLTLLFVAW